ncbi:MAG: phosphonate C-P lyase system protein PhnH [Cyanobacteria bacterium P01_D01_bin.36]
MQTTTLPGFANLTNDSQQTFRALLTALAEPGKQLKVPARLAVPKGLTPACGAACLTLIDFETVVWLSPTLPSAVKDWLRFHTGCTFTTKPAQATFAVISDGEALPLTQFSWGSAEMPEAGATLLIQVQHLQTDNTVLLSGPGILESRRVSPAVSPSFWQMWQQNHAAYPRGVDCFLFSEHQVMGLPRSTQVQLKEAM